MDSDQDSSNDPFQKQPVPPAHQRHRSSISEQIAKAKQDGTFVQDTAVSQHESASSSRDQPSANPMFGDGVGASSTLNTRPTTQSLLQPTATPFVPQSQSPASQASSTNPGRAADVKTVNVQFQTQGKVTGNFSVNVTPAIQTCEQFFNLLPSSMGTSRRHSLWHTIAFYPGSNHFRFPDSRIVADVWNVITDREELLAVEEKDSEWSSPMDIGK